MKLKAYSIVSEAISQGIEIGHNRAYKHDDNPSKVHILECIQAAIMYQLSDIIDWEDEPLDNPRSDYQEPTYNITL